MDPGDVYSPGLDEKIVMVVTGKIHDKGAPKVQRGGCEAGRVDTSSKLQVFRETKFADKGGES